MGARDPRGPHRGEALCDPLGRGGTCDRGSRHRNALLPRRWPSTRTLGSRRPVLAGEAGERVAHPRPSPAPPSLGAGAHRPLALVHRGCSARCGQRPTGGVSHFATAGPALRHELLVGGGVLMGPLRSARPGTVLLDARPDARTHGALDRKRVAAHGRPGARPPGRDRFDCILTRVKTGGAAVRGGQRQPGEPARFLEQIR